jgi:hypothetical protein
MKRSRRMALSSPYPGEGTGVRSQLIIASLKLAIVIAPHFILPQRIANPQAFPVPPIPAETTQLPPPPSERQSPAAPIAQSSPLPIPGEKSILPVGLSANRRNIFPSVLVRGQEDGLQAIDFQNWLIPYDAVIQTLKFTSKPLPDGQVELRSPGLVKLIDPSKLRNDPQLGLVFSVQDLEDLFQIKAVFDVNEYAIQLQAPWTDAPPAINEAEEAPVILTGLPRIKAPGATFSAISQRINTSNAAGNDLNSTGDLAVVGSIFGGSWFVRTNQPDAFNPGTWRLTEGTFFKQSNTLDWIAGSQAPFWLQQGLGQNDYWGATAIARWGFKPPTNLYGSTDTRQRLQAAQIGRSIAGRAAPGTLARLTQSFSDRPIAEVLVDSSGIYRFENLKFDTQSFGGLYRVLLYPQGQLTANPEIRDATFLNSQEQLPKGAAVLISSIGLNRESNNESSTGDFFGNFSTVRGGLAGRWGVSNNVTIGVGGVFDKSPRALTELYFQPGQFPLRVAASALSGDGDNPGEVLADIRFEPTKTFSATLNSDRFSSRLNLNWQAVPSFGLFAGYDTGSDVTSGGFQASFSKRRFFSYLRASIDTENRIRWSTSQYLPGLKFTHQGNEVSTLSDLTYSLSRRSFQDQGHSLIATYETQNSSDRNDNLMALAWRYRSRQQASDGNYLWETQLGYGIGSQGSGPVASVATTIIPGLLLRTRYQQVSAISDRSTFNLELVSNFNLQQGITPGDRRSDYLRSLGGVSIQPFFDRNQNGKRDGGEDVYLDNPELLIILNNRPLKGVQAETNRKRLLVRLPPGTVRIDIDPAGFPPDWQATGDAYAVDIAAGSYTLIQIPLIPAYTLAGVVVDAQGQPVGGARVEAISVKTGDRVFSVTNDAGVYYLERLKQGTYSLQINGKAAQPNTIEIEQTSKPLRELNLSLF